MSSWARRRPELDFSPVEVVSRLGRVRGHIDAALDRVFEANGLVAPDFAVLVTLARVGDEDGISQRRLMEELGLTSGTISVRVDRLVASGLVQRAADPASRRATRITLTERGRELFERVVPAHLENERRLLSALDDEERGLLAALLRKLLVEFEGSVAPPEDATALGLAVAPVHATIELRQSVGLPPADGLLVRAVQDDGPAAVAGLRTGDVLVRAGTRELRSVSALYAAIADAGGRPLDVSALRGGDELHLSLAVTPVDGARARTEGRAATSEHRL